MLVSRQAPDSHSLFFWIDSGRTRNHREQGSESRKGIPCLRCFGQRLLLRYEGPTGCPKLNWVIHKYCVTWSLQKHGVWGRDFHSEVEEFVLGLTDFRPQRQPLGPGQPHTSCCVLHTACFRYRGVTAISLCCYCFEHGAECTAPHSFLFAFLKKTPLTSHRPKRQVDSCRRKEFTVIFKPFLEYSHSITKWHAIIKYPMRRVWVGMNYIRNMPDRLKCTPWMCRRLAQHGVTKLWVEIRKQALNVRGKDWPPWTWLSQPNMLLSLDLCLQ